MFDDYPPSPILNCDPWEHGVDGSCYCCSHDEEDYDSPSEVPDV